MTATNAVEEGKKSNEEGIDESFVVGLIKPLVFPTVALLFLSAYFWNTYGDITLSNLTYPYTILVLTLLLLVSVYVSEVRRVFEQRDQYSLTTKESVLHTYEEWKLSLGVSIIAIGYVSVLDIIGFFTSSTITILAIMYMSGVTSYKLLIGITTITIVGVYLLFVGVLDIRPPEGMLI